MIFSIKKIECIIRCFNEIEEFSLSRDTQKKIIIWLRDKMQDCNKYIYNNKELRKKIKEMNEDSKKYQVVAIVLEDESIYYFTGPACIDSSKENLKIKDVIFYSPRDLPEGANFSTIEWKES